MALIQYNSSYFVENKPDEEQRYGRGQTPSPPRRK